MLFVGQAVGFIAAGAANSYLSDRLGLVRIHLHRQRSHGMLRERVQGRVITIGAIVQAFRRDV